MTIYHGLQLIDRAGLPHPDWQFVRSSRQLKLFTSKDDYVGWTIRTVKISRGPWNNLYVNWLPKAQVPQKIDELQTKQHGRATFVVYPSWRWKKGGTILIEKGSVIIEAVRGPIVNLMRHGQVGATYIYRQGKLADTAGNKQLLTSAERRIILQAPKRIKQKNVMLEWGISTKGKFIFYRIEDIREAAKLLLKKYK